GFAEPPAVGRMAAGAPPLSPVAPFFPEIWTRWAPGAPAGIGKTARAARAAGLGFAGAPAGGRMGPRGPAPAPRAGEGLPAGRPAALDRVEEVLARGAALAGDPDAVGARGPGGHRKRDGLVAPVRLHDAAGDERPGRVVQLDVRLEVVGKLARPG